MKRRSFVQGAAAAALGVPHLAGLAQQSVTLKFHTFMSPMSGVWLDMHKPWMAKVEKESGGRIKFEAYPAMQLGGTPVQLYDQARDGVVDVVWTLPGNTAGRFPRIEVFELPFMMNNAEATSKAFWEYTQLHCAEEFKETQVLALQVHGPGLIHTANKPINTVADLRGLKVRGPTRQVTKLLASLGATPVGMPLPQIPDALSKGTIEGCVIPWEVVPAVKVHELTKFHSEFPSNMPAAPARPRRARPRHRRAPPAAAACAPASRWPPATTQRPHSAGTCGVQVRHARQAAAQHDDVGVQQVDHRRQRARQPRAWRSSVVGAGGIAGGGRCTMASPSAHRRGRAGGRAPGRAADQASRRSRAGRSSRPAAGLRPGTAQGSGLWPHSPARPLGPRSTRPCTAMPAPVPVPRMAAKTTSAPAAGAVGRFAQGQAVGVVGQAHRRAAQAGLQVALQRLAVQAGGVAVLHQPSGVRLPGVPMPTVNGPPAAGRRPAHQAGQGVRMRVVALPGAWRCAGASLGPSARQQPASVLVPPRSMPSAKGSGQPSQRVGARQQPGQRRAADCSGARRSRTVAW
jgi:TRAP-type C4-dicarboxylate transport system substrate-binding protein